MSAKKFIVFGKMLALLLLISGSVSAKAAVTTMDFQNPASLNKAGYELHKNMLQPQFVHITASTEHSAKPTLFGYAAALFNENARTAARPTLTPSLFLQDADRCETVSRLLFPYHIFW